MRYMHGTSTVEDTLNLTWFSDNHLCCHCFVGLFLRFTSDFPSNNHQTILYRISMGIEHTDLFIVNCATCGESQPVIYDSENVSDAFIIIPLTCV